MTTVASSSLLILSLKTNPKENTGYVISDNDAEKG
jgi:hypothetical protein